MKMKPFYELLVPGHGLRRELEQHAMRFYREDKAIAFAKSMGGRDLYRVRPNTLDLRTPEFAEFLGSLVGDDDSTDPEA